MIFETEKLLVRNLVLKDLVPFHELENNPNVLRYADGEVKSYEENKKELYQLIEKYSNIDNDFWIYAIERINDKEFVGTVALISKDNFVEIGYRFLEKYWGNGYGYEICDATITYCKDIGIKKLVGYVVNKNIASAKILEKCNFKVADEFVNDGNQQETKYELIL